MIGIVVSIFNKPITDGLLRGCITSLKENGFEENSINIFHVPGAFELPGKVKKLTENNSYDCIIALGCIIKGDTDHDKYISNAVSNGLLNVSIKFNKPVIFGVLTTNSLSQALDRCGGKKGNKGEEAAYSLLRMLALKANL